MAFNPAKRPVRSITDLQADSATVRYELDMLLGTANRYGGAITYGDIVGQNMAVESFAIHCRALILFLFGHLEKLEAVGETPEKIMEPRKNDIIAWDYHHGWDRDCPAPSDAMHRAKRQADKHVAHIVTQRRGVNQPGTGKASVWALEASVKEIVAVMALFVSKAPAINFDASELRRMQDLLAPLMTDAVSPPSTNPRIAKSGPLDDPSVMVGSSAKTDARTMALPPGIHPYGTTKPQSE